MRKHSTRPERQDKLRECVEKIDAWTHALSVDPGVSVAASNAPLRVFVFRCALVTPMYGGGVRAGSVDTAMPIRATGIRGQLRRWWRLLALARSAPDVPTSTRLFEIERAVWGGLGGAGSLTRSAVSVAVSASRVAPGTLRRARDYRDARYALFSADEQTRLLPPGLEFRLTVSVPEALAEQMLQSIRWWAAFGGVGARTRRGLGAVLVRDDSGRPLPMPDIAEINAAGCSLALVKYGDGRQALGAWEAAIRRFETFRQGPGVARRDRGQQRGATPGRSLWPEPDSIRRLTGQALRRGERTHAPAEGMPTAFPRALFGLPIITHFKDGGSRADDDPRDTELVPVPAGSEEPATRMASPLLLRPMWSDGVWYAGALVLPHEALRKAALMLRREGRQVALLQAGEWWKPEFAPKIDPLQGQHDPVAAFLDFLRAGGVAFDPGQPRSSSSASGKSADSNAEYTLQRPWLRRNNGNGSLVITPRDGKKPVTLIGQEAQRCFDALSPAAQRHLRESRNPPFNRVSITLDGTRFVKLEEDAG